MNDDAEKRVSAFYNSIGWETRNGITEDAKRFEDLRDCARDYISDCRLRVKKFIPDKGEYLLDMASGPLQYQEYIEYSRNFKKRYCVDLSKNALDQAKKKIGDHGIFLCGSFFDIPLEKDFFDCTISLHTIYHIDKKRQEEAVRKLIHVTKPGKKVVIVYSNPYTPLLPASVVFSLLHNFLSRKKEKSGLEHAEPKLYFYAFPISWWQRFSDISHVQITPWRSFSSDFQQMIVPDNIIGKKMLKALFWMENMFPKFFVYFFQYPMIILTKK
jgi:SAM-dependent methyltransferase